MWVVTLSDGTTVYQMDEDSRVDGGNSWLSLKKYTEENKLYIKDMIIRFRDHAEVVGSGAEGYFFIHMALGHITGYTQLYYSAGVLEGDLIKGHQWIIPEIMSLEQFTKKLTDPFVQDSLIRGIPIAENAENAENFPI